jgi:prepilin peptidase CpaA
MPVVRGPDYLLDGVTMHLLANELPANSLLAALLLTVMAAAWTDFHTWRIPNSLLAPSAAAALMLSAFVPAAQGLYSSLLGAAVGLLIFLPLYILKGMAAGDVKLMTVIGLYAGPQLTLDISLLTALIGGLWVVILFNREMSVENHNDSLGVCLRHRTLRRSNRSKKFIPQNKSLLIPYGVVIAVGTIAALGIASTH